MQLCGNWGWLCVLWDLLSLCVDTCLKDTLTAYPRDVCGLVWFTCEDALSFFHTFLVFSTCSWTFGVCFFNLTLTSSFRRILYCKTPAVFLTGLVKLTSKCILSCVFSARFMLLTFFVLLYFFYWWKCLVRLFYLKN